MKTKIVLFQSLAVFAVCAVLLLGCVTPQRSTRGADATCYVCKYNNDLACVEVQIVESTPRSVYEGKTYYFCSQDCLKDFSKRPAKYLPKAE